MEMTETLAIDLCRRAVENLAAWPLLPAVLQVGGIESRGSSRIMFAIESWLSELGPGFLVLPEYRLSSAPPPDETTDNSALKAADQLLHGRIDYAIVRADSIGRAALVVDAVIEVKTNYFCQADLRSRPRLACAQAARYGKTCNAPAYVLYIVASAIGEAPAKPRDAGWGYYRSQRPPMSGDGPINVPGVQILGQYPAGCKGRQIDQRGSELWACVLEEL